jgi:hypothetical protein
MTEAPTRFPEAVARARRIRPVRDSIDLAREALESALDQERRILMKTHEERLAVTNARLKRGLNIGRSFRARSQRYRC